MPERPIILFPEPEKANREKLPPFINKIAKPSFEKQYSRLQPEFAVLKEAFEKKKIQIQNSPTGMNPEYALVFEIVGSVDNFYTAVKKLKGWNGFLIKNLLLLNQMMIFIMKMIGKKLFQEKYIV